MLSLGFWYPSHSKTQGVCPLLLGKRYKFFHLILLHSRVDAPSPWTPGPPFSSPSTEKGLKYVAPSFSFWDGVFEMISVFPEISGDSPNSLVHFFAFFTDILAAFHWSSTFCPSLIWTRPDIKGTIGIVRAFSWVCPLPWFSLPPLNIAMFWVFSLLWLVPFLLCWLSLMEVTLAVVSTSFSGPSLVSWLIGDLLARVVGQSFAKCPNLLHLKHAPKKCRIARKLP